MIGPSSHLTRALAICFVLSWSLVTGATEPTKAVPPPKPIADSPSLIPSGSSQALHDAVAAVVVVALTEQFSGKDIAVDIDDYNVQIASAGQRVVTGHGTAHIDQGGKNDAVGFEYRTLFDVVSEQAGYPTINITGVGGGNERMVPNDSGLVAEIDDRVSTAMSGELGGKQVWLQLDDIESYESGDRYVRIDAKGLADFGTDGRSSAKIEALYDSIRKTWLRVSYELGDGPGLGLRGEIGVSDQK